MALGSVVAAVTALALLILIRFLYVVLWSGKLLHGKSQKTYSTLVILGSGGHTAEMLNLLSVLQKERFAPRFYVAAATDIMSLQKARVLEDSLVDVAGVSSGETAKYMQIYRSREILCNGPGTCIPLCIIAFLFKVLGIRWSSIFYFTWRA
ncbi:hypothetical protein EUGRSUZ_G01712 [Eucalyptus grandis]|uniref:Uncharacterized protein n=2 Tax=Eucalyptus grandis TaxID=71139 RepID=A0ACC3K3U8_EUCGR|nr:hypothetical protein EUGRSUZ_G01712 [Eucalyptus grandis]